MPSREDGVAIESWGGQTPKGKGPCVHGVTHSLGIMHAEGQGEWEKICQPGVVTLAEE